MADIDISIYYNERRLEAMKQKLAEQGTTVEAEVKNMMDVLYESILPREVCDKIDAQIAKEQAEADAEREASRRFAVYHIRENGEDYHFTSDYFQTVMQSAYRYRLYERGELADEHNTFFDAFVETQPISLEKFNEVCTDMNSDKRVTALVEFDLDNGSVSICDSSDNAWWCYSLRDFSVAAYKAYRAVGRSTTDREKTFAEALAGKEIFPPEETENGTEEEAPDEDEDEAPVMRM